MDNGVKHGKGWNAQYLFARDGPAKLRNMMMKYRYKKNYFCLFGVEINRFKVI